jgi:hypothetical protein
VVITTTGGEELDPDGYTVLVDTEAPQAIGSSDRLQRNEMGPGEHSVRLEGLASNCSVAENPRTIRIVAGETLNTEFVVTCTATTGSVVVNVSTSGSSIDIDGYSLILDGVDRGAMGVTGQVTVGGLAPGSHVTGLGGIAGNCQIQGDNLRTITVTAGASTTVDYVISCVAPPPGAGTLRITTVTTGSDPDANGYAYALDGDDRQPIGANTVVALTNLSPGVHRVQLSDIAGNCRLEGANPRSATVPPGGTGDVSFTIVCSRAAGSIRVTTSTSGPSPDRDGYVLTLDGATPGTGIGVDGTERFNDVAVGSHTVVLNDVAANCTVADGPSRSVAVTAGATSEVNFRITCSQSQPQTGSIRITTRTGGVDQDPDGYQLFVDGSSRGDMDLNHERVLSDVAAGDHSIELRGVAGNCQVAGGNPRTVTVAAGQQTTTTFDITCSQIPPGTGSIRVRTDTDGQEQDPDGYEVFIDGINRGAIGRDDEMTFADLSPGNHTIELREVSGNCAVENNPRTETVTAGGVTTTTFQVNCSAAPPTTGSIRVRTDTDGPDQDSDGYELWLDGSNQGVIATDDGNRTFEGLSPGEHNVELRGVAENCSVEENNPRTLTVTAGQETSTTFRVNCSATTGSIRVETVTSGDNPDGDGYVLMLDGENQGPIDPNTQRTFSGLSEGDHDLELTGIEGNCEVTNGSNPRMLTVTAGREASTTFEVTCTATEETGSIRVSTATQGDDPDDGYGILLDDVDRGSIGRNEEKTFSDLSLGPHAIELTGVADNCQVAGDKRRTVIVTPGEPAASTYDVICAALPVGALPL